MVVGAGTVEAIMSAPKDEMLTPNTGPAHAVYFATYEAVKHAMGGNNGDEHHPLAAGERAVKC